MGEGLTRVKAGKGKGTEKAASEVGIPHLLPLLLPHTEARHPPYPRAHTRWLSVSMSSVRCV